jgi:acyl-coenzyme A synthetase/AMP-(fatty) acid ligase
MQERSQIAAGVPAGNGVGPGDAVALMCFNTPAFVEAVVGAWRLATTVVPLNHKLKAPKSKGRRWVRDAIVSLAPGANDGLLGKFASMLVRPDGYLAHVSAAGSTEFAARSHFKLTCSSDR